MIAMSIGYALRDAQKYPTYCGRLAALYESTTGWEWWSAKPLPEHRWASFVDRFHAVSQMIRDGVIRPDGPSDGQPHAEEHA
jgi:hypothetical protein